MENQPSLRMTSQIHPIPDDVRDALCAHGCVTAYRARPPYQQNEYISWIVEAKTAKTRQKRLEQMLCELKDDGTYMNTPWENVKNQ